MWLGKPSYNRKVAALRPTLRLLLFPIKCHVGKMKSEVSFVEITQDMATLCSRKKWNWRRLQRCSFRHVMKNRHTNRHISRRIFWFRDRRIFWFRDQTPEDEQNWLRKMEHCCLIVIGPRRFSTAWGWHNDSSGTTRRVKCSAQRQENAE